MGTCVNSNSTELNHAILTRLDEAKKAGFSHYPKEKETFEAEIMKIANPNQVVVHLPSSNALSYFMSVGGTTRRFPSRTQITYKWCLRSTAMAVWTCMSEKV